MLREWFSKFFYSRGKYLIYILGSFSIIYLEKFNINIVFNILIWFSIITIIWVVNIFLRKYLLDKIIVVNEYIYKKFFILIKLRWEFINIPLFIRIILSLFMYVDMFLLKILHLYSRTKNTFYFIRLLIYYNILIWITLPFFLIVDLYFGIIFFLENAANIGNYLKARMNFLMLTIIFALLFNIKWINIVILLWILDTIFTSYYYWISNYLNLTSGIKTNWNVKCTELRHAFNSINLNYYRVANSLIELTEYRNKVILLFKGIWIEKKDGNINLSFSLFKNFYIMYIKEYWNEYFLKFLLMKNVMWFYYNTHNDEDFILKYIHTYIIGSEISNEKWEEKQLLVISIEEIINDETSNKIYEEFYYSIYNVLAILKMSEKLRRDFFIIRKKYNLSSDQNYTDKPDVIQFFEKLYKFANDSKADID